MIIKVETRAGEPANFLAATAPDFFQAAPAPDFFPKRLRLRLQGAKNTRLRLLGKIFFSLQTSKGSRKKKFLH